MITVLSKPIESLEYISTIGKSTSDSGVIDVDHVNNNKQNSTFINYWKKKEKYLLSSQFLNMSHHFLIQFPF